jgi:hypothetical protein
MYEASSAGKNRNGQWSEDAQGGRSIKAQISNVRALIEATIINRMASPISQKAALILEKYDRHYRVEYLDVLDCVRSWAD